MERGFYGKTQLSCLGLASRVSDASALGIAVLSSKVGMILKMQSSVFILWNMYFARKLRFVKVEILNISIFSF